MSESVEPIAFVSIQVGATVYNLFIEDGYTLESSSSLVHLTANEAFHRRPGPKDKDGKSKLITRKVTDFEAFGQAAYSLQVQPPSWWANRYD